MNLIKLVFFLLVSFVAMTGMYVRLMIYKPHYCLIGAIINYLILESMRHIVSVCDKPKDDEVMVMELQQRPYISKPCCEICCKYCNEDMFGPNGSAELEEGKTKADGLAKCYDACNDDYQYSPTTECICPEVLEKMK